MNEHTYRINEVCELTDVAPHVLRMWEKRFSELSPRRDRANCRVYSQSDVEIVRRIKRLVHHEKLTSTAAKRALSYPLHGEANAGEISGTANTNDAAQETEEFAIRVGQAFKHYRELRKMSQVELAEAAGCSQGTISLVESGEHSNLSTLRRLCEVLNCEFSRIIRLAEKKDPRIDELIQRNKKLVEKLRQSRAATK